MPEVYTASEDRKSVELVVKETKEALPEPTEEELREMVRIIPDGLFELNLDYFINTFFINKRKKIKSNKNITILIDEKI